MMLLLAVLGSVGAWAQSEVVSIGNTDRSDGYLPIDQYSKYSLTQQIYTKDEINHAAGKITSIAFYGYDYGMERTCDVYLTLTTKNAFESNTDWVKVAPEDKVLLDLRVSDIEISVLKSYGFINVTAVVDLERKLVVAAASEYCYLLGHDFDVACILLGILGAPLPYGACNLDR